MRDNSPNMLESSSPNIHHVAGIKRLLPAFEPNSSPPPRFKRQKSRSNITAEDENLYPTPIPSSSIGILPSSPPNISHPAPRRPLLRRTQSTVSERAPLSAVPSIVLPESGEEISLGRSSNSSHYRLSANRLISRVHIKAAYHAATETEKANVQLKCVGWNGVKVHCQGRAWDLQKDDIFMSETEGAEIMLDVHDSRVVLEWPPRRACRSSSNLSGSPITGPPSSGRVHRSPSADWEAPNDENVDPWEHTRRISSRAKLTPVSPTPRRNIHGSMNSMNSMIQPHTAQSMSMAETFVDIYEDEPVSDDVGDETQLELPAPIAETATKFSRTSTRDVAEAFSEIVPQDEIAHSFLGSEPVLPPMTLFSTAEPLKTPPAAFRRHRSSSASSPLSLPSSERHRSASISPGKYLTLQNHLTNQLAFSRVNTMPLSELFDNLPTALATTATMDRVKEILIETACIGEIKRVGKDAAGKPLENQYYYIMEEDRDEGRKAAVGGRAGMRSCRKSHKQYYWKKPKKISN
ncbi:hypothetical protein FN846DRAFT_712731 [Sphaerosporella brunnea]|uniref:FHA domain-containing protein n=1 Tax=Sphaerosporella brunnea TaxID=1250544 RepID=A0A5J5EX78_9PEZI|nr:hypothetical protein FN846DRAFT_712731 [Sphaerosporella brunnea]